MKRKYHLTFSMDWAPDSSIQLCLDILSEYKAKATFFATHQTELNNEILRQGHELGIHPNFMPNSSHGNTTKEIIDKCLEFAPNARLMKTHSLFQSTPLFVEIFSSYKQLTTDLSLFMHEARHVQKCQFALDGVSFTRVLYNWEDDADFVKKNFQFDKERFFGDINIFDFHPIHIHLNSTNGSEYLALKNSLSNKKLNDLRVTEVDKFSNPGLGMRDFLRATLESNSQLINLEDI